ncbi:MAG: choice-of-anchor Q domain-containing protein [Deinococcota bacterium]
MMMNRYLKNQRLKNHHLKNYLKPAFVLAALVLLAACGDPNTNTPPLITQFDVENNALDVTFSWQLIEPDGDRLTCQLDVDGDGLMDYTIRDCALTTSQLHSYETPGQYEITLLVDDGKGESGMRQQSLSLDALLPGNSAPEIDDFSAIPNEGDVPLVTTFTWLVFDAEGDVLSCQLDPADGSTPYVLEDCLSTTTQPHIYTIPGNYNATLQVDDGGGGRAREQVTAQVFATGMVTLEGSINLNLARALAPTGTAFAADVLALALPDVASYTQALEDASHAALNSSTYNFLESLQISESSLPQPMQVIALDREGRLVSTGLVMDDGFFSLELPQGIPVRLHVVMPERDATDLTSQQGRCSFELADVQGTRWLAAEQGDSGDTFNPVVFNLGVFNLGGASALVTETVFPSLSTTTSLQETPNAADLLQQVSASETCLRHTLRAVVQLDYDDVDASINPADVVNVIYGLAETATGELQVVAASLLNFDVLSQQAEVELELPAASPVRLVATYISKLGFDTASSDGSIAELEMLPVWQLGDVIDLRGDTDLGVLELTVVQREGYVQDVAGNAVADALVLTTNSNGNQLNLTLARSDDTGEYRYLVPVADAPYRSSTHPLADARLGTQGPLLASHFVEDDASTIAHKSQTLTLVDYLVDGYSLQSHVQPADSDVLDSAPVPPEPVGTSQAGASRTVTMANNQRPVVQLNNLETSLKLGRQLVVDASSSFDPEGEPLTYSWRVLNRPEGSRLRLADVSAPQLSFTPDMAGSYDLEVLVSDGQRVSLASLTLEVTPNRVPVASLASDTELSLGEALTLTADVSDLDGDTLMVRWELERAPVGSALELPTEAVDILAEGTTSLELVPDAAGVYELVLELTDGESDTQERVTVVVFDDFSVTTLADSGRGSLRHALAAANTQPGADVITVNLSAGDINLVSPLPVITEDLQLTWAALPEVGTAEIAEILSDALTVSIVATRNDMRIFEVAPNVQFDLKGLRIRGGRAATNVQRGGGLFIHQAAQVTLESCIFEDHSALAEGGAVASFGYLKVHDCLFEGSVAAHGGAIYAASESRLEVGSSAFVANSATRSGGALFQAGQAELTNVHLTGNSSLGTGGGVWSSGNLELDRSVLKDNSAVSAGGGIYQHAGRINLIASQLEANTVSAGRGGGAYFTGATRSRIQESRWQANISETENGGGLFIDEGVYVEIDTSTFAANRAAQFAGGLENFGQLYVRTTTFEGNFAERAAALSNGRGAILSIDGSLFVGNQAAEFAGGIANFGDVQLVNTTLSGNRATFGGALLSGNNATRTHVVHSTIVDNHAPGGGAGILHGQGETTVAHSIVLGNTSEALTGDCVHTDDAVTRVISLGHNLLGSRGGCDSLGNDILLPAQALFRQVIEALADNGGPTRSHALLPQSPAVDAGANANQAAPDFDQRGEGFSRFQGEAFDIGAFEVADIATEAEQTAQR